ncbi:hypothetical protein SUGI_0621300 [Cryptomeria japonica]|uniref:dynamin-related protein 5A n=1 Tax=Cryptomeria japonica TaxID=3369 RepID=UPI0024146C5C|nr:dynamin-related protein 5A [Cryptomeria japonica]GLJ31047.1 hypothetical protein SUGI_0621300 [Cryptomeria japonica]
MNISRQVTPRAKAKQGLGEQKSEAQYMDGLYASAESRSRLEAYNRLQASAVAFGEKLPIPEIVVVGGQSDGKSSLLEALLGFRFNVREVEMGTRRPLMLQMVHDPSALEPRCRFQDEDSDDYGAPVIMASAVADTIKGRTEEHLKKIRAAVSAKPIVMRAEYAHCPNLTIIDTPGFVLKAKKGEPDSTPEDILSMVKALAAPPHRLLLFLQQSSVEWCSSLWLDTVRAVDPTLRRTIVVVSKFDNRLKEFGERWEVDRYLSANGYLGERTKPFFVALPKDKGSITNEEFRTQISHVDAEVIQYLKESVIGGYDEENFGSYIGFRNLRFYLENELQRRYREAAPATLALLEQRCSEVAAEVDRINAKLQSVSDVASLRRSAMIHAAAIARHVGELIDGAADPDPEEWGRTTDEERSESGVGQWPGLTGDVKPANASLKLHGGAAFERVMYEFRCATCSIECPPVSREKVANILLANSGRGGGGVGSAAAAGIARAAARSWLAPMLDAACGRLAFVLRSLFDLAVERKNIEDSSVEGSTAGVGGYIAFNAALRRAYDRFIHSLTKKCKELVRHHLDSVTSPYSQICGIDSFGFVGIGVSTAGYKVHRPMFLDLSEGLGCLEEEGFNEGNENIAPEGQCQETPNKGSGVPRDPLRESQMTVPETPSPELPSSEICAAKKKDYAIASGRIGIAVGVGAEVGGRKRAIASAANDRAGQNKEPKHGLFGEKSSKSAYTEVCSLAAQHFGRIREALIDRSVPSTLNAGFLTPCRDRLVVTLGLELFAVTDETFMDMFVAPGAVDQLQNELQTTQKRHKTLQSCLNEFRNLARVL